MSDGLRLAFAVVVTLLLFAIFAMTMAIHSDLQGINVELQNIYDKQGQP